MYAEKREEVSRGKVRLVKQCIGGKVSYTEAARIVGVDFETVKTWVRQYKTEGVSAFLQGRTKHTRRN